MASTEPDAPVDDLRTTTRTVAFKDGVGEMILGGPSDLVGVQIVDRDDGSVSDVRSFDGAVVVKVFADVGDGPHSVQVTTRI